MSTKGRTGNSYVTPGLALAYTRKKAISQDWRESKSREDAGFSSLASNNLPNTTATTPPGSSTQDSLPSLTISPSSIRSWVIQTPGTKALEEVLPRHLCFSEEASPTHDAYVTDSGNWKSSCWKLEPVLEDIVGNEPSLEIGRFLKRSKSSNEYAQNQKGESQESYQTSAECQVAQHIQRPSTPENQIIQPYCASTDTGSWNNRNQFLARQGQSAGFLKHYRSSSLPVSAVATIIVVIQRCIKRRVSNRNSDLRLREAVRESRVLSKEVVLALNCPKQPDIAAWILGCKNSSTSRDNTRSFENDSSFDDFGENGPVDLGEKSTVYLMPPASQTCLQDYVELARENLSHLPNSIAVPIIASLTALFKSKVSILTTLHPATNSTPAFGSFDSAQSGSAPESSKSIPNSKKRAYRDRDDEPPDTDDESRHKKRKLGGKSNNLDHRKWACPFYQKDPHRYCVETEWGDFRRCAKSPGFPEVHRIKNHIEKFHYPKYCDRCFTPFKQDEDLEEHRRILQACDVKERPIELLTTDQKKRLKPRDKHSGSDEERWKTIYKICFPLDQVIPSPYYVHYSQERTELQSEVLGIIEEETRLPSEIDINRLLRRVNEAFDMRRPTGHPAAAILRTPLILTPSTSHDSNGSTELSSQTQARESYIASPSVRHYSERVALATSSGNNRFPSSESLNPHSLPRLRNGNQTSSLDELQIPSGTEDHLPILGFGSEIKPLNFGQNEQNEFDMLQVNQFNYDASQLDLNDYSGLFGDYEGEFETNLEGGVPDDI